MKTMSMLALLAFALFAAPVSAQCVATAKCDAAAKCELKAEAKVCKDCKCGKADCKCKEGVACKDCACCKADKAKECKELKKAE